MHEDPSVVGYVDYDNASDVMIWGLKHNWSSEHEGSWGCQWGLMGYMIG